ncbi:hypothetical protein [Noviherbaspirillum pedocola]|uniref:Uncharacterized protein n=1 Tax=Noviherbaspirillum pedocola TaxID=2801341 RepID=A0A934W1Z4_9BURK|nr:hypothetical protein [Noviherbaspirillum pedocola]MBK4735746.1 hypothetical protein [Noviherbaspirillum pedocola]
MSGIVCPRCGLNIADEDGSRKGNASRFDRIGIRGQRVKATPETKKCENNGPLRAKRRDPSPI